MAAKRIEFEGVYASSEHSKCPVSGLDSSQHGPAAIGWRSDKFCLYPVEIILHLCTRTRLKKFQLLAHQFLIPTRIELGIGYKEDIPYNPVSKTPYSKPSQNVIESISHYNAEQNHDENFSYGTGFGEEDKENDGQEKTIESKVKASAFTSEEQRRPRTMYDDDATLFGLEFDTKPDVKFRTLGEFQLSPNQGYKERELKSFRVEGEGNYIRLLLFQNYRNHLNQYNQVAIAAINIIGNDLNEFTVYPYSTKKESAVDRPIMMAIKDPDYISALHDIAFSMYQDPQIAYMIRCLDKRKTEFMLVDNYHEAKRLNVVIGELLKIGQRLCAYENDKKQAIIDENYERAEIKKRQINEYRAQTFNRLQQTDLLKYVDMPNDFNENEETLNDFVNRVWNEHPPRTIAETRAATERRQPEPETFQPMTSRQLETNMGQSVAQTVDFDDMLESSLGRATAFDQDQDGHQSNMSNMKSKATELNQSTATDMNKNQSHVKLNESKPNDLNETEQPANDETVKSNASLNKKKPPKKNNKNQKNNITTVKEE